MIGNYEHCRDFIRTGDVVFFKNGTTLASKLTQVSTRSPYFHVGIAFWINDPEYKPRLMIVEAHPGGRRIVSLSSYADHAMDIISFSGSWYSQCDAILDRTGAVPYGYENYVSIGLKELFGLTGWIGNKVRNLRGQVCSELVAEYAIASGLRVERQVSPGLLFKQLRQLGFEPRVSVTL